MDSDRYHDGCAYSAAIRQRSVACRERRKRMRLQRVMGFGLLLISALFFYMALIGPTFEDKDCTALLLTVPLGLYMLFTKEIVIR